MSIWKYSSDEISRGGLLSHTLSEILCKNTWRRRCYSVEIRTRRRRTPPYFRKVSDVSISPAVVERVTQRLEYQIILSCYQRLEYQIILSRYQHSDTVQHRTTENVLLGHFCANRLLVESSFTLEDVTSSSPLCRTMRVLFPYVWDWEWGCRCTCLRVCVEATSFLP